MVSCHQTQPFYYTRKYVWFMFICLICCERNPKGTVHLLQCNACINLTLIQNFTKCVQLFYIMLVVFFFCSRGKINRLVERRIRSVNRVPKEQLKLRTKFIRVMFFSVAWIMEFTINKNSAQAFTNNFPPI